MAITVAALAVMLAALPTAAQASASSDHTTATATGKTDLAPYFFIDEPGHDGRPGPFLLPVQRRADATPAVGRAALEALFDGPTAQETARGISSAIPDGTQLLLLTIANGKAKVHVSDEFAGRQRTGAGAMRAAQVVFTLTRFPTVDRVVFFHGNDRIRVTTASGDRKRVVTRDDYLDFVAGISVETPVYRGRTRDTMRVSGVAAVFEATFNYKLRDASGAVLERGIAMTDNGAGWGSFDFTIDYDVPTRQRGVLKVWEFSAKDGSKINVRRYPVILAP